MSLIGCTITDCTWGLEGPAARTVDFLRALHASGGVATELVERIERDLDARFEGVAKARVEQRSGTRINAAILDQRARPEIAPAKGTEPPEILAQGDRLRREADDSPLSMDLVDALAVRFAISMQAAARRMVEETKQDCALAISFRSSPMAPLTTPHLYCSRTFEERFRWKQTGSAAQLITHSIGAARHAQSLEPIVTTDVGGRAATIEVDPLTTPRALLVLFRALPGKSRLARLASVASGGSSER